MPPAILLLLLVALPARAADLVLDGRSGPYVEAYINGVPLRLRVDFDHSNSIALNGASAARAGLGHGDGKWIETIGPVKLEGRFARPPVTIGGWPVRAKVNWRDMPTAADADGTITPHLLPFDTVVLQRRAAKPGEREIALPAKIHDNHGVHVPVRVGGREIAARLSFRSPRTTAPAAAAAVIAQHHGGELGQDRSLEEIKFGISRPARPLRLARALRIGDLAVSQLMARSVDFRGKHKLARPQTPPADGAIVVRGRVASQDPLYRITLGLDVLDRCSTVTYDRSARELRLRCLFD